VSTTAAARHRTRRVSAALVAAVLITAALVGCSTGGSSGGSSGSSTLNVVGGSELKDLAPILSAAQSATGVAVKLQYTGSLDGAERVAAGSAGDAAWFASDKYVQLAGAGTKVLASRHTMLSPVAVGVRQSVAARLGWTGRPVGWGDISTAAAAGRFKYAMTNAVASNSGFSALVGVADALAKNQALSASTIDAAGLRGFLTGQALSAGSSGFLADAYVRSQDTLDGIVNYESVLLTLNSSRQLHEPLTLIYPSEGIITADYPLMLLSNAKRAAYDKLVTYLTRRDVQERIQRTTSRRPAVPGVPLDARFPSQLLVEAPFPANLQVVQVLLDSYQTDLRRPANTVYVLDVSGSMNGDRLSRLKAALTGLTGVDQSFTGKFARFSPRERVTFIPFSSDVQGEQAFTIDSTDPSSPSLRAIRDAVNGLRAGGGTAIYSALDRAYQVAGDARRTDPGAYTSIVLLTDGENNQGISSGAFLTTVRQSPAGAARVPVFTVLFGEANPGALQQIADATGGRVFDARTAPLNEVFKEIRGYQ
jgi:Ca-activated chloride channel family protein